jgi:sugar-specific transcriptional regulator TrmB
VTVLRGWAERAAQAARGRRDALVLRAIAEGRHTAAAIAAHTGLSVWRVYACTERLEQAGVVDPYLDGQWRAWRPARVAETPGARRV